MTRSAPVVRCPSLLAGVVVAICLAFASSSARAGEILAVTGDHGAVPLRPMSYLIDRQGMLGPAEAEAKLATGGGTVADKVFSQGYTAAVMWVRVEIEVAVDAAGAWYLALELPNFDRLDVYPSWLVDASAPGASPAFALGDRVPEGRALGSRFHIREVMLPPGRHSILFRGQTSSTLTVPLQLWRPAALHTSEQGFLILQGFYIGIALLLAAGAIALSVYLRQIVFLIFAANAVSHGMLWLILNGVGPGYVWPALARTVEISSHGFVGLAVASIAAFSASFLTGPRVPRAVRAALWLTAAVAVVLAVATFVTPRAYSVYPNAATNMFMMPTAFVLIVGTLIALVRGDPAARFLSLAWSGLMVGAAVAMLRDFGMVPSNVLTFSGPQLGSTIEMLVFAFMLAAHIGGLQREKERLQAEALTASREQEALLEVRVAERTAALDAANRRLAAIVEAAPFPLLLERESDDVVLFMNQRAAELFAVPEAVVLGRTVPVRFVRTEARSAMLADLARGDVAQDREVELRRTDGSSFWALHSAVRIEYDGQHVRLMAFNDISSMKALEGYLRSAAAQDREARRIQRQFVEMVSHEFRTPLAVIDGAAQNLAVEDPRDRNRVQKIRGAVQRLLRMIHDCLVEERGGNGRIDLNAEMLDLRELLEEAVELSRSAAPGHEFHFHASRGAAPSSGDRRLIEIAVGNLLENAVKYSPPGSSVEVSLLKVATGYEIHVADEGAGVLPSERGRIFEKYYRSSNTVGTVGAGLGLHLVREIVEAHGGRVAYAPREGGGSFFTLSLPVETDVASTTKVLHLEERG